MRVCSVSPMSRETSLKVSLSSFFALFLIRRPEASQFHKVNAKTYARKLLPTAVGALGGTRAHWRA